MSLYQAKAKYLSKKKIVVFFYKLNPFWDLGSFSRKSKKRKELEKGCSHLERIRILSSLPVLPMQRKDKVGTANTNESTPTREVPPPGIEPGGLSDLQSDALSQLS